MVRVLIILVLICYTIYKVGNFAFRLFAGGLSSGATKSHQNVNSRQHRQRTRVDTQKSTNSGKGGYKGGEYVDYEEVE